MQVKKLKEFLAQFQDEQFIVLKSESGLEWNVTSESILTAPEQYKEQPIIKLIIK